MRSHVLHDPVYAGATLEDRDRRVEIRKLSIYPKELVIR